MDDSETILFQAASEGGFRIDGLRTLMGLIHGMSMRRSFSGETAHLPAAEVVGVLFASALERFGPLYQENLVRRFLWRLGVAPLSPDRDLRLVATAEGELRSTGISPDAYFFTHRGGRAATGASDRSPIRVWSARPSAAISICTPR